MVDRPRHQEGWQGEQNGRQGSLTLPSLAPTPQLLMHFNQNDEVNGKTFTVGKSDETGIADWAVTISPWQTAVLTSLRNFSISKLAGVCMCHADSESSHH